jgi:hypothetical protein
MMKKSRKGGTPRERKESVAADVLKFAEGELCKLTAIEDMLLSPEEIIKFLTLGYQLLDAEYDETEKREGTGIAALAESIRELAKKVVTEHDKKGRNNA